MTDDPRHGRFREESSRDPVSVNFHPRDVDYYGISDAEIRMLVAGYSSPALSIAGVTFGVGASLFTTLKTVSLDVRAFATFTAVLIACIVIFVLTASLAARDWWNMHRLINEIKARRRPSTHSTDA